MNEIVIFNLSSVETLCARIITEFLKLGDLLAGKKQLSIF